MSTASMTTARWREYSIAVWVILTVIAGMILWYSWDDSVVQLAFYKDGGNSDTTGMGGSDGRLDRWWLLERHGRYE